MSEFTCEYCGTSVHLSGIYNEETGGLRHDDDRCMTLMKSQLAAVTKERDEARGERDFFDGERIKAVEELEFEQQKLATAVEALEWYEAQELAALGIRQHPKSYGEGLTKSMQALAAIHAPKCTCNFTLVSSKRDPNCPQHGAHK